MGLVDSSAAGLLDESAGLLVAKLSGVCIAAGFRSAPDEAVLAAPPLEAEKARGLGLLEPVKLFAGTLKGDGAEEAGLSGTLLKEKGGVALFDGLGKGKAIEGTIGFSPCAGAWGLKPNLLPFASLAAGDTPEVELGLGKGNRFVGAELAVVLTLV